MKLNASLVKSTVVAALGGLLFGFDTAVISGTTSALASTYHLSPTFLLPCIAAPSTNNLNHCQVANVAYMIAADLLP